MVIDNVYYTFQKILSLDQKLLDQVLHTLYNDEFLSDDNKHKIKQVQNEGKKLTFTISC